jgi:hypothetical protein
VSVFIKPHQVSIYMTEYFRMMSDLDRAVESGERALTLATTLGDVGLQVKANFGYPPKAGQPVVDRVL